MSELKMMPGTGGERYIPYDERTGDEAEVFFTRDLSAEGLKRIFERVSKPLAGKVAIKLHTGEKNGPNIIPREWVRELIENESALNGASIVETNTFYEGDRDTTEKHRETLEVNGWTFCPVDITDEEGTAMLPVNGGKWFTEMSVGKNLLSYDSMLTLTHFKGHLMGGFGGSNKNIGIGCADGKVGKAMIHRDETGNDWGIHEEELMERISESTKATVEHFGEKVVFINVMRNMSVSCDCEGTAAEPVVTPDVGIVASTDILAADQACVDLVYALEPSDRAALVERIETRHGHRQLSYMKELGMGHDKYRLIDIDNGDAAISPSQAVEGVVPFGETRVLKKEEDKAEEAHESAEVKEPETVTEVSPEAATPEVSPETATQEETETTAEDEKQAAERAAENLRREKRGILKEAREALRAADYDPEKVEAILLRFDNAQKGDADSLAEQELIQQREELGSRNESKKKRREDQAKSIEKKRGLIERAKELKGSEEWKKVSAEYKSLMEEWRQAGNSGPEGDSLWEEFNAARQEFFDRQKAHYDEVDTRNAARKEEKEQIIKEAREAAENTAEWGKTHEILEGLFARWKSVGAAGRDEERLWSEFQEIRHGFYEKRSEARREQEQAFAARREDKEALIKEAEGFAESADYSAEAAARMREMGSDWKDIGFCGRKQENELWERFHAAQDAYWQGRKSAGSVKHEEWIEKTRAAIERRNDRIVRLKDNIESLKERLNTSVSEEKKTQIEGWIAENEEQIRSLEEEVERMEREIEK